VGEKEEEEEEGTACQSKSRYIFKYTAEPFEKLQKDRQL